MLRGCVSSREGTSIWLYVVNIFLDTAAYIVHRYVFRKLTLSLAGTWGTSLNMNVKQKRVPLSFSRWFGGNSASLKPAFCFLARWCNRNMETFCRVPNFLGTIFSKTPIFLRADCFQQILLMVQNSPNNQLIWELKSTIIHRVWFGIHPSQAPSGFLATLVNHQQNRSPTGRSLSRIAFPTEKATSLRKQSGSRDPVTTKVSPNVGLGFETWYTLEKPIDFRTFLQRCFGGIMAFWMVFLNIHPGFFHMVETTSVWKSGKIWNNKHFSGGLSPQILLVHLNINCLKRNQHLSSLHVLDFYVNFWGCTVCFGWPEFRLKQISTLPDVLFQILSKDMKLS